MAPPTSSQRTKLSKHLLEMKFMQRTKEKVEQEDEERRDLFDYEITDDMRKGGSKYVVEQSFIRCENLVSGRMSFNGFNPEIEKLMLESGIVENEGEEEVSKEDMAERFSTLVNTMAKKFTRTQNFHVKKNKPKPVVEPTSSTANKLLTTDTKSKLVPEGDKGMKRKLPAAEFQGRKRAAEFWKPEEDY